MSTRPDQEQAAFLWDALSAARKMGMIVAALP